MSWHWPKEKGQEVLEDIVVVKNKEVVVEEGDGDWRRWSWWRTLWSSSSVWTSKGSRLLRSVPGNSVGS